jgi:hypothetical protein
MTKTADRASLVITKYLTCTCPHCNLEVNISECVIDDVLHKIDNVGSIELTCDNEDCLEKFILDSYKEYS